MDEYDERQGIAEGNVMEGLGENPQSSDNGQAREDQEFGGLMTGQREMPVCKHLLACFLAESWTEFAGYVEEGLVGREEMGSWAAGWGG